MITIYHKPGCTTSNKVLAYLKDSGKRFRVVHYLEDPPSEDSIRLLLKKMNLPAAEWVRKKEPLFVENFRDKNLSEDELIRVLHLNPNLLERPVLEKKASAILGRPLEKAQRYIDGKRKP